MPLSFNQEFDQFGQWREHFGEQVQTLRQWLGAHELLDAAVQDYLKRTDEQLAAQKIRVGFVAESRRGKSKLINAVFFAHYGRHIIRSHPSGATLCPIELDWDPSLPACLRLLPIETREQPESLAWWRHHPSIWVQSELNVQDGAQLAAQMAKVAELTAVTVDEARRLGFWVDESCAAPSAVDNPPVDEDGMVHIPKWRYALVNLPHPLLRQGLAIVDMPGLLAASTEPELNVHLIGQMDHIVFLLAADEGLTAEDREVWASHLLPAHRQAEDYLVVLNKIDAIAQPENLANVPEHDDDPDFDDRCLAELLQRHLAEKTPLNPSDILHAPAVRDCQSACASALGVPEQRLWPLSAHLGMVAKAAQDPQALTASGLADFERALTHTVLSRRRAQLSQALAYNLDHIGEQAEQVIAVRLRSLREQRQALLDLAAQNDPDAGTLDAIELNIRAHKKAHRASAIHIQAMRSAHLRLMNQAFQELGLTSVRQELELLGQAIDHSGGNTSGEQAYALTFERLRTLGQRVIAIASEIQAVLSEGFAQLNAQFGFALRAPRALELRDFGRQLATIEESYLHYLQNPRAVVLLGGGKNRFAHRLLRALELQLQALFELAARDLDVWSQRAMAQFDAQLAERERGFERRLQAIARIRQIGGALPALTEQITEEIAAHEATVEELRAIIAELQTQVTPPQPPSEQSAV